MKFLGRTASSGSRTVIEFHFQFTGPPISAQQFRLGHLQAAVKAHKVVLPALKDTPYDSTLSLQVKNEHLCFQLYQGVGKGQGDPGGDHDYLWLQNLVLKAVEAMGMDVFLVGPGTKTQAGYTISDERVSGDQHSSRYGTSAVGVCEKCKQPSTVVLERGGAGYFAYEATRTTCCDAIPYKDKECTALLDYDALMGY